MNTHTQAINKKEEVKTILNSRLKRGDKKRIAEKHNVTPEYVSYVIAGKYENAEILESLLEQAQAYENAQDKILALKQAG